MAWIVGRPQALPCPAPLEGDDDRLLKSLNDQLRAHPIQLTKKQIKQQEDDGTLIAPQWRRRGGGGKEEGRRREGGGKEEGRRREGGGKEEGRRRDGGVTAFHPKLNTKVLGFNTIEPPELLLQLLLQVPYTVRPLAASLSRRYEYSSAKTKHPYCYGVYRYMHRIALHSRA